MPKRVFFVDDAAAQRHGQGAEGGAARDVQKYLSGLTQVKTLRGDGLATDALSSKSSEDSPGKQVPLAASRGVGVAALTISVNLAGPVEVFI